MLRLRMEGTAPEILDGYRERLRALSPAGRLAIAVGLTWWKPGGR